MAMAATSQPTATVKIRSVELVNADMRPLHQHGILGHRSPSVTGNQHEAFGWGGWDASANGRETRLAEGGSGEVPGRAV